MMKISASSYNRKTARALLRSCLNDGNEGLTAESVDLTASDWDQIAKLAILHEIGPLLYHRILSSTPQLVIAAEAMKALRETYSQNASRNLRIYSELHRILTALHGENIDVVVMKGARLAQTIYRNVALRTMTDVDLLVRKADVARTDKKLQEMGYSLWTELATKDWYINHHYHFPYTRANENASIELHWNIQLPDSPFRINIDELMERAQAANIAGVQVLVLSPEDTLLHLSLQISFQNLFTQFMFRSLIDISEVIRHYGPQIDWGQLEQRAHQWEIDKCVYVTLRLARELTGAQVPDRVLLGLKPRDFAENLLSWAEERALSEPDEGADAPLADLISDGFGQVWASGSLHEKLSALWRACFPPPRILAHAYSIPLDAKVFFYYPVRFKDLITRYARTAWQLLRRDEEAVAWMEREGKRIALISWMTYMRIS